MRRIVLQFHFQKTFFVINEEQYDQWLYAYRMNTLALVKHGFTRDEAMFMSIPEVQDYIKLINDAIESEREETTNYGHGGDNQNTINDIKMAGTVL